MTVPYRDFHYPLNVFVHLLEQEEGSAPYLHYGLFERADEGLAVAQEHSTELLRERLPPAPARILEVGIGLGTTMRRLLDDGYSVEGITPDDKQVAMVKAVYGDDFPVCCTSFELFDGKGWFDVILFQESSQYIDSEMLFQRARSLICPSGSVLVLDEFAVKAIDAPGALRSLERFLAAAQHHGFRKSEDLDLSAKAAPTVDYVLQRIPRYRETLISDLGLTEQRVEQLITRGLEYRERYATGVYGYRLLALTATR
jgi:cyclopropane fatty-acyl-phospholipid synthase-like methyltransferase